MSNDNKGKNLDPFELLRKIKVRGPAPVHQWDPPFCGDMDMLIARDGTWIHEGTPIRRPAMVKLFASVLKLEGGKYYLVTPVEKVGIQVEDCPFIVQQMDVSGHGSEQDLIFTTNLDEKVTAGAEHPLRIQVDPVSGEPHPTIHVRSGLNALINRAVFYRLVELAQTQEPQSGDTTLGIFSGGKFFPLDEKGATESLP
ncbi:MAG: DUF1285 domain-containing protein [Pseudohongiellaceae bacterium]